MKPQQNRGAGKGFFRSWVAEWPKIAAALTVTLIVALVTAIYAPIHDLLVPPPVHYPVICFAEPVQIDKAHRRVEIYLINTSTDRVTEADLAAKLQKELGKSSASATPIVFFPYSKDEQPAISAEADARFNDGKGELVVRMDSSGVYVEPRVLHGRAILKVDVLFVVDDDDGRVNRAARGIYGMFDLTGPEEDCFTR